MLSHFIDFQLMSTQELGKYDFGSMKIQDVAVTFDGARLLGVGPLLESPDGLQPSRSRVEKRITGRSIVKKFDHRMKVCELSI